MGPEMEQKWAPKWIQKWTQKWTRNGPEMEQNGAEMGPEMEQKWPQNGRTGQGKYRRHLISETGENIVLQQHFCKK